MCWNNFVLVHGNRVCLCSTCYVSYGNFHPLAVSPIDTVTDTNGTWYHVYAVLFVALTVQWSEHQLTNMLPFPHNQYVNVQLTGWISWYIIYDIIQSVYITASLHQPVFGTSYMYEFFLHWHSVIWNMSFVTGKLVYMYTVVLICYASLHILTY